MPDEAASDGESAVRLKALDGLRAVAITLVVAIHCEGLVGGIEPREVALPRAFFLGGHTGVSLFFVLSAFLLSRPFLAEAWGGRRVDRGRYFLSRVLRIMPLYVLAVMLASIACATQPADLLRGIPYLFFLNSVSTWVTPLLPYSGVWWSLATEVQFYLLLPLLPLLLWRRSRAALALAIAAILYAALALGWLAFPTPAEQFTAAHSILGRAPLFAWGIVAAWIHVRHGARIHRAVASAGVAGRIGAEVLLLASALALGAILRGVVVRSYVEIEAGWPVWHVAEGGLWAIVLLTVLLAPTALGAVLRSAPAGFLGDVSYPLFFVHTAVLMFGAALIRAYAPGALMGWSVATMLLVAALLALAVVVATIAHVMIERPALRWKARLAATPPSTSGSLRGADDAARDEALVANSPSSPPELLT